MPTQNLLSRCPQRGAGLIEVLVALVILALGTLAAAGLQLVSKRAVGDSGQNTLAQRVAFNLIDAMRMNDSIASLAQYVTTASAGIGGGAVAATSPTSCTGSTTVCSGEELAIYDLLLAEQLLDGQLETVGTTATGGLPEGRVCIASSNGAGSPGIYTVTVVWRGKTPLSTNANVSCGLDAVNASNVKIYGDNDEYRRSAVLAVFIQPS